MINNNNILIGLVIILVITLVFHLFISYRNKININGFWVATDEFCQEADLDKFIMYFDEKSITRNKIKGYILVKNNEGIIINTNVDIKYKQLRKDKEKTTYSIDIIWKDGQEYDFFPKKQTMLKYKNNKLVLLDKDEITTIVYYDSVMSDVS